MNGKLTPFYIHRATVVRHRTKSHDHRTTLPRDPTMMSASRQTIVVKSYDLVRLSYDGRKMSDDFPTIVPDASQTHRIQCDHKTKIVIS